MTNEAPPATIRVGDTTITQEHSTTLLGMKIQDDLGWSEHFHGKNGLIPSLNKRLYAIRRVSNHVPQSKLIKLAHALWMSKMRYGLQLCSNTRLTDSEPNSMHLKSVQITVVLNLYKQNRTLNSFYI